ncbi:hypothetical protein [Methylobacterium sp. SyP6R]|uniref:hypothetical protein n=1 Tax=Methylobacterium sp. SyP6R TaxID=2718876 RepID=UPI001F172CAE|nr:hypothetical protein [Methylobacterium sp. SyP6R]MCF4127116.1 hypothetical protein [Methylobacterium sp. SyP6R]
MPRFVVLLATGLSAAILYNVARAVLEGTLDPVVVPLVAGLVAWSSIIVAITLPLAERRLSVGTRLDWKISAQISLVLALLDGARLWRLPGGYHPFILAAVLAIPVMALTTITSAALFTRAERDAWRKRARRQASAASDDPPA